jgi:ribonuclease P/MRP protein subunit RPP40
MEKIISALEKGHFTIGIFLDFSKAFDTVNHNILLEKLKCYGIRGSANSWIASYLQDRQQYTSYNGKNSPISNITCGVPQGSILSPILFLIYINDFALFTDKLTTIMFADDTNLFSTGSNLIDITNNINHEIPLLLDWLRANRLSLNAGKTHVMVFGPKNKPQLDKVKIKIDTTTLDIVDSTKFL